jgi:hypothetical protein
MKVSTENDNNFGYEKIYDLIPFSYDYQNLILTGISLIRKSDDLSPPNNYGYRLIDLCKRNNLYIGNSRLPGNDFIKGKKKLVIIYR